MDARFLQQFCAENRGALQGARVTRVTGAADGLLLALDAGRTAFELALFGAPGAAWTCCLGADARAQLHAELGTRMPELVDRAPGGRRGLPAGATALDALRAWLVRPLPAAQSWSRLEGAHLTDLRTRPADRRLWIDFETRDSAGRRTRLELLAELLDRAANFFLRAPDATELVQWRRRRPAPEPPAPPSVAEDANLLVPVWDAAAGRLRPGTRGEAGLSLAAAAHADLARASARAFGLAAARTAKRQERRLRARLARLEADSERAAMASTWRHMAELLTANLKHAKRGQTKITVEDFYTQGKQVDIELDPALSPQENATRLFQLARRGARGRDRIEARLQAARAELDALHAGDSTRGAADPACASWPRALEQAAEMWDAAFPAIAVDAQALWAPGGPRWTPTRGVGAPRSPRGGRPAADAEAGAVRGPGRRFVLPGGWEVRVGRSNAENDALTHGFAHPDDVWLHASGVPGSHVVLRAQGRSGNPPREILEAAAAIAARYSQAKHAGTVPVIWTRKRYVRKPRGAKPGLATCTHEKTLFVKPGLPDAGADGED